MQGWVPSERCSSILIIFSQVFGELSSPTSDLNRFLTISRQLFVSDASEIASHGMSSASSPVVGNGKLKGTHVWPFSIDLPKGVCIILLDGVRNNFRLPPTLTDRVSKAQIEYQLIVRVKKGTLSAGQRLIYRSFSQLAFFYRY